MCFLVLRKSLAFHWPWPLSFFLMWNETILLWILCVNLLVARWLSETRRWKGQWVYRRFQISGVMQTTCKIMCVSISLYKSNHFTFKWMRVERGQEYSRDSTTWKEWTKFSPTPLCSWHGESLSSTRVKAI